MTATREMITCNVCEGDDFNHYMDCDGFFYVRCRGCGLVLQNPQPTQHEINNIYDESYFHYEFENHNAFFHLMELSLNDINFNEITKKYNGSRKVLDIGCATGLLLNKLQNEGWDSHGVEICEASAQYARDNFNLNIYNKNLFECNFPDNHFEVIHFSHLIEHVPNPKNFLKEVYRILQPNGYIIVTTPNVEGFFVKIFKSKWRSAIFQHLFLFSKKSLKKLLIKTGFSILKQISWGGLPIEVSKGKIKKLTDRWVKQLNLGDVMLFLATKKG